MAKGRPAGREICSSESGGRNHHDVGSSGEKEGERATKRGAAGRGGRPREVLDAESETRYGQIVSMSRARVEQKQK